MQAGLLIRVWASLAAVAACAATAPSAAGHIQVSPSAVAPGDPVRFELLVPGERSAHTIEVALEIPDGVLPFSFEEKPGWHRAIERADDGSIAVVRWHGDMRADSFVRFAFLAATPPREGQLAWKAVQRYSDGSEQAWIGPPSSENPSARTTVSASVPRQNAGGEGTSGNGDSAAREASEATPAPAAGGEAEAATDDNDTLALVLAIAALALGAVALAVALRRNPRTGTTGDAW
jgi:hypothetical protein